MARHLVSQVQARALGDLREAKPGDVIVIREGAQQRKDWSRYLDAITAAVAKGADVRWIR